MQDLTSQGTMGLYSFSYGLAAMFVASTSQSLYRQHPLTHFTLTFASGLLTAIILSVHGWLRPVGQPFMPLFYTALIWLSSPRLCWALQRFRRAFRFQPNRRNRMIYR